MLAGNIEAQTKQPFHQTLRPLPLPNRFPLPFSILIIRPQEAAKRFAAQLHARLGQAIETVISPLMSAEFFPITLPEQSFNALILTSETGALAAGSLKGLPKLAFCVGDRTADAARQMGFNPISAAGAAGDLAALIASQPDMGPMIYLHGEDRAADIAALLPQRQITSIVAYRQIAQTLSAEALALLGQEKAVILPIMSPRSARLFAKEWAQADVKSYIFPVAISKNTRNALPDPLAKLCQVAQHPDAASVIRAIEELIASAKS